MLIYYNQLILTHQKEFWINSVYLTKPLLIESPLINRHLEKKEQS